MNLNEGNDISPLDDLQRKFPDLFESALELWPGISAISIDISQPWPSL